jgi:hypothetical protein
LVIARQMLYYLRHATNLFCFSNFSHGVLCFVFAGWGSA